MNGQDFLIDQCVVSREIHGARADFDLVSEKSRTNHREGQNGLFPRDKCTPMNGGNPEFPFSKSMLISVSLYPEICPQSTAFYLY